MAQKIPTKELLGIIPTSIQSSDLLSFQAKKVLGALLHWSETSRARDTGRIIIDNESLCTIASVSKSTLTKVQSEFNAFGLVKKISGKPRTVGEPSIASEYVICFKKLLEPIQKVSFEERFKRFLNPSETPVSTVV